MIEYRVIESSDVECLRRLVEEALNENGWKLHGGVSATYVPEERFGNGEQRTPGGWFFYQAMTRTERGKDKAATARDRVGYPYAV